MKVIQFRIEQKRWNRLIKNFGQQNESNQKAVMHFIRSIESRLASEKIQLHRNKRNKDFKARIKNEN